MCFFIYASVVGNLYQTFNVIFNYIRVNIMSGGPVLPPHRADLCTK